MYEEKTYKAKNNLVSTTDSPVPATNIKITIITYLTLTGHIQAKLLRQDASIYDTQTTY